MDSFKKKDSLNMLITSDIRDHAHDWTLAGDVRLLGHLEQFSEDICSKAQETQKLFTELVDNYEEVYTKICNVTNQLLALQNCQFVENRVYDEETPTEEKTEAKISVEEDEKQLLMQYKEAVEVGVKILDTHFQEVQLPPNSDSEEEDEMPTGNALIWKPKNPYTSKKFPLLIGSNEWWADDKIGLGDYEENLDTEKIVSESESDVELNQKLDKRLQSSFSSSSTENGEVIPTNQIFLDTSSEDLFVVKQNNDNQSDTSDVLIVGNNIEESKPLQNSNEEKHRKTNDVLSEDDDFMRVENISKSEIVNPKVNSSFTEELIAKLASVTNSTKDKAEEKAEENSPAKKPKEERYFKDDNLFDEIDDSNGLFSGKVENVSVGNNALLFDTKNDNDDRLFGVSNNLLFESENVFKGGDENKINSHFVNATASHVKNIKVKKDEASHILEKPLVNDFFDDSDDGNILFNSKGNGSIKSESSMTNDTMLSFATTNLERDSSEGIFNSINYDFETSSSKIPFKNKDFENHCITKKKNEEPFLEKATSRRTDIVKQSQERPRTSLFDTHGEDVGVFGKERKINTINFPSEDDDVDLFSSSFKEESLFGEKNKVDSSTKVNDDDDFYDTLFVQKPKDLDSLSISSSKSSLFDDVGTSKSRLAFVFEKDKNSRIENDLNCTSNSLLGERTATEEEDKILFSSNQPFNIVTEKEKSFLFYDLDDSDDLFGPAKEKENNSENKSPLEKTKKHEKGKKSLFDGTDDWEKQVGGFGGYREKAVSDKIEEVLKNRFLDDLADDDLFNTSKFSQEEKMVFSSANEKDMESTTKTEVTEIQSMGESKSKETRSVEFEGKSQKFGETLKNSELFKKEAKISEEMKSKSVSSFSLRNDVPDSEAFSETKPVGKLNIPDNLKVKFESTVKLISPEQSKPNKQKEEDSVKNKGFEESFEPLSNFLKCPSKDRIRIQARRRPQSRRARQEAIRNSDSTFGLDLKCENLPSELSGTSNSSNTHQKDPDIVEKKSVEPFLSSPVLSNPLSPSTDEEDFFNVPELDTNYEKDDQSIFKNNLFYSSNTSKADDNLLFDKAPVLSPSSNDHEKEVESKDEDCLFVLPPMKTKVKQNNIFDDEDFIRGGEDDDDDDEDEGLFKIKNSYKKEIASTSHSPTKNFEVKNKSKTSIFDTDLEDENDLFENNSSSFSGKSTKEKTLTTNDNKLQTKKKETPSFVDPLGLISNDKSFIECNYETGQMKTKVKYSMQFTRRTA